MKTFKNISLIAIVLTLILGNFPAFAIENFDNELRGVWVATVLNIDYPSSGTTNSEELKKQAIEILEDVEDMGLNAVFLQVRPTADAFYDSSYFPWSKYLTGAQGIMPDKGFDPLKFWIEEAHKRDIELHAWINPYRITKNYTGNIQDAWNQLVDDHIAKRRKDLVVEHYDGNLYFNPGLPEVRNLVAAGALEIVQKYDVDGIHFDDYFYPGTEFDDKATFNKYGSDYNDIGDWRRDNVTELIKLVNSTIEKVKPEVEFGISPFGIWANKSSNSLGSDTRGNQSYYSHYADTRLWVKEGYVDYINPQIYWNIGFSIADYKVLVDWWTDVVEDTDVKLYVGHAAYKAGNDDPSNAWYGDLEIIKQIRMNEKDSEVDGSVFFSYRSFINRPSLMDTLKLYYDYRANTAVQKSVVTISEGLSVTNPYKDITSTYSGYYIYGVSDPKTPLYMNGKIVLNRSSKGYFGVFAPLSEGENIFTFTQSGQSVRRVITVDKNTWKPTPVNIAEISASSLFPKDLELWSPGDKVSFKCYAPIGSIVSVMINGETFKMMPATEYDYGEGIYNTSFSYQYTIPNYDGKPRVISLGDIKYSMNYKGIIDTKIADGKIYVIMDKMPMLASVTKDFIDSYRVPDPAKGSSYILTKGMQDYITAIKGDYYRLSFGNWVKKSDVKIVMDLSYTSGEVLSNIYKAGVEWDYIDIKLSHDTVGHASFDGEILTLKIFNTDKIKQITLPNSSIFSASSGVVDQNVAIYQFMLSNNHELNGYIVEKTDEGIRLSFKEKPNVISSSKPLSGMTILIDPGHGGSDSGALGILGSNVPEKAINLSISLLLKEELESYGARVVLSRTNDIYLSLQSRLALSRNIKPDLFISIHVNSVALNRDINNVKGFSVHYQEALAKPVSQNILDEVVNNLDRNSRGINVNNFYVVRGTWTPSVLVEMAFMPNPIEFDYIEDESGQRDFSREIARGIVEYFK